VQTFYNHAPAEPEGCRQLDSDCLLRERLCMQVRTIHVTNAALIALALGAGCSQGELGEETTGSLTPVVAPTAVSPVSPGDSTVGVTPGSGGTSNGVAPPPDSTQPQTGDSSPSVAPSSGDVSPVQPSTDPVTPSPDESSPEPDSSGAPPMDCAPAAPAEEA